MKNFKEEFDKKYKEFKDICDEKGITIILVDKEHSEIVKKIIDEYLKIKRSN